MKKITLLLIISCCVFKLSAQGSMSISTINGMTVTEFNNSLTSVGSLRNLVEGTTLTIVFNYTDLEGDVVIARLVAPPVVAGSQGVSFTAGGTGAAPVSGTNATVTITVPDVTAQTNCRIQLFNTGSGGGADTALNIWNYTIQDLTTLSVENMSRNKLSAFYNLDRQVVKLNNVFNTPFSIYNIMGKQVLTGVVNEEINVDRLKSGMYILSTAKGSFKFVK